MSELSEVMRRNLSDQEIISVLRDSDNRDIFELCKRLDRIKDNERDVLELESIIEDKDALLKSTTDRLTNLMEITKKLIDCTDDALSRLNIAIDQEDSEEAA